MADSEPSAGDGATPLGEALEKNKQATETVREAVDDLAVVHTVLEQEATGKAASAEVEQAVAQTKRTEKRLDETVELLDQVNEVLEGEVGGRKGPTV